MIMLQATLVSERILRINAQQFRFRMFFFRVEHRPHIHTAINILKSDPNLKNELHIKEHVERYSYIKRKKIINELFRISYK